MVPTYGIAIVEPPVIVIVGARSINVSTLENEKLPNSIVEVEYTDNITIDTLKSNGFVIYALEITDTAKSLKDIVFKDKTCLVIGNEQYGIPQNILDKCDDSYYIEMVSNHISSLNLSIATSIALYKYIESMF